MRLQLDASPQELCQKAQRVLDHLASHCEGCDADLADHLRKALPPARTQSEHKAMRQLQGELRGAYAQMMERLADQIVTMYEQESQNERG